ncbi:MAG: hypothetical protein Q8933_15925 [Bacteroidota bacterium]|nr:hypothetical protein [Bacteroidota bacterium]MDP4190119.1 hypothetical protein [Bacteroidota bacterium]MDP4193734.1 hypothetical protein [Bacteroidota bacterium]
MNRFRKSIYNFTIVLVYLVTLQVCLNSAFYSIYFFSFDSVPSVREQPETSEARPQVVLRKHLSLSKDAKDQNQSAYIISSFSLTEKDDLILLKAADKIDPYHPILFDSISGRAPPKKA